MRNNLINNKSDGRPPPVDWGSQIAAIWSRRKKGELISLRFINTD